MKNKLAYYNDIDPVACAVVEKMIEAALIPDGNVECKSITDIEPEDISDYGAVHMFCGIGLWPLALRQAGWPDPSEGIPNSQVWTGSPPCQPFSVASTSKYRLGFNDERHLSPEFERLIKAVNPTTVYFEQVSGASGKTWFSALQESLEGKYSTIGISSGACTVGSPMLRKRIYGVADRLMADRKEIGRQWWASPSADSERQSRKVLQDGRTKLRLKTGRPGEIDRCERGLTDSSRGEEAQSIDAGSEDGDRPTPHYHNFWANPDYIYCRDGYYRPIRSGGGAESATFCLLNGYPGRSASLRLLGNGIVVPQAQAFIESHIEAKIEMEKINDSDYTD